MTEEDTHLNPAEELPPDVNGGETEEPSSEPEEPALAEAPDAAVVNGEAAPEKLPDSLSESVELTPGDEEAGGSPTVDDARLTPVESMVEAAEEPVQAADQTETEAVAEEAPRLSREEIAMMVDAVEANIRLEQVTADVAEMQAETPSITLRLYTPLNVAVALDYVRYGLSGVPLYGPLVRQEASVSRPAETLCMSLAWQDAEGHVRLTFADRVLRKAQADDRAVVWTGGDSQYGLAIAWVWDFYRMLSVAYLRVWLTSSPTPEQTALQDTLQRLAVGDVLRLWATLPTGDIDQQHPVTPEVLVERDSWLEG